MTERQGSRQPVMRHSLASVASGGPLYPPLAVRLAPVEGMARGTISLTLRRPDAPDSRVDITVHDDLLDDPQRLSDLLESMLRTLCPQPDPGRLP